MVLTTRLPPRFAVPETVSRSVSPAATPSTSSSNEPEAFCAKLPCTASVPVASPTPLFGRIMPLLVRPVPPTTKVPPPASTPVLVKPPALVNVAPPVTFIVPACVKLPPAWLKLPALTFNTPLFVRSTFSTATTPPSAKVDTVFLLMTPLLTIVMPPWLPVK